MATLQKHLGTYAEWSAAPLAVSVEYPEKLRRYAERRGIAFPLLMDKKRSVIKSYGVYHWLGLLAYNPAYNMARPSTFIVDKVGNIRFMYIGSNQFDLAEQEEILGCLKLLGS